MVKQYTIEYSDNEIEEVDIEVGFILGTTCTSLELEDDDDLDDDSPDAVIEYHAGQIEEVDIEVGFILGTTCTSLELEDDDDLDDDSQDSTEGRHDHLESTER